MRFTWPVPTLFLALACAAPRTPAETAPPTETAPVTEPAPIAAPIAPPVVRGMDAAEVRSALGEPARVEHAESAAAKGSRYERWIFADRVVVLLDGKVVDVAP
jgi:hypothetical protein